MKHSYIVLVDFKTSEMEPHLKGEATNFSSSDETKNDVDHHDYYLVFLFMFVACINHRTDAQLTLLC